MKAEELMIGDWVKITLRNKIGKVYRIDEANGKGNGWVAVIDGDYHETHLEPIPLTPEILEKNGWEQCKVETCKSLWEYHGLHLRHVIIKRSNGRWVANVDGKAEIGYENSYLRINIYYVHQLQHALRLCGIEKGIEL